MIQCEVNNFWKSWSQLVGPDLFNQNKWHTLHRNVSGGDVVWVCEQNSLWGQYKLGRVVKASPDARAIVRDVDVKVVQSHRIPMLN